MPRIFVQVASYRDPQLLPTLRDLDQTARHPELVRFGICRQFHPGTGSTIWAHIALTGECV